MPHQLKARRKYQVKTDALIQHIVRCIRSVSKEQVRSLLDDYEQNAIRNPSEWAKHADLCEIMVIMVKLGFDMTIHMMDLRTPLSDRQISREVKDYSRKTDAKSIIESAKRHQYFVLSGRETMKNQALLSLFCGGVLFKSNSDSTRILRSAAYCDFKNQEGLDTFMLNIFEYLQRGYFDLLELNILFLIRKFDSAPLTSIFIHERLSYFTKRQIINSKMAKLHKHGYVEKFGNKRGSSYSLSAKGWAALIDLKKYLFRDIRVWTANETLEINQIENGSSKNDKEIETEFSPL